MAKAVTWTDTDAQCAKAWGANRIRYPGSPRCKRWALGVAGIDPCGAAANALSAPLGSTDASLKLKGIDGGPHKRWSMWFNSTQRAEPYRGWKPLEPAREGGVPFGEPGVQVLHGCRQLVS